MTYSRRTKVIFKYFVQAQIQQCIIASTSFRNVAYNSFKYITITINAKDSSIENYDWLSNALPLELWLQSPMFVLYDVYVCYNCILPRKYKRNLCWICLHDFVSHLVDFHSIQWLAIPSVSVTAFDNRKFNPNIYYDHIECKWLSLNGIVTVKHIWISLSVIVCQFSEKMIFKSSFHSEQRLLIRFCSRFEEYVHIINSMDLKRWAKH